MFLAGFHSALIEGFQNLRESDQRMVENGGSHLRKVDCFKNLKKQCLDGFETSV